MKRLASTLALTLLCALWLSSTAQALGLHGMDVTFTGPDASPSMQAGSHPFAFTTSENVDTSIVKGKTLPVGNAKDVVVSFPPGLVGDPTAVPRCSEVNFLTLRLGEDGGSLGPSCQDSTAVGVGVVRWGFIGPLEEQMPLYNLVPPPGVAAKIGFMVSGELPVTVDLDIKQSPPYNLIATSANITTGAFLYGSDLTTWGVPASPVHDEERGGCLFEGGSCPVSIPQVPFLLLPRSCEGPQSIGFKANSWQEPANFFEESILTHDGSEPPNPLGFGGCGKLGFAPSFGAVPSTEDTESPTGLAVSLDVNDEGLLNPKEGAIAQSDLKKAVVTLPEGITANPSAAEALATCSPAQLEAETLNAEPGQGCPQAAKVGTVEVESPLLEGRLFKGTLFIATPDDPSTTTPGTENPFDSLLALYVVIKEPQVGIIVKLAGKVEPDPTTGQLVTTFEDAPQLPFSHFRLHFREGGRSLLISPPTCGNYETKAELTPWANPTATLTTSSAFKITGGINGAPCPPGGIPPFHPEFEAGSLNNNAKSYSPFDMRLLRHDGEQDMTKFSSILPPGVLGKLAGVSKCPDAAIAIARAKTGRQEQATPSCPANSRIGHTLAGAGVGTQLTYVGGSIYLGGPYHGDPLSVIAITPAVAGPFDAGDIVVREALTLNPETAEVEVDGKASDPIPHILKGIVLKVREIRVYVDRPEFIINPTSCDPSSAKATLFGGYLDVFSPNDDVPVDLSSRYQAANCLNLGFKPKLSLNLNGGTKRGGHPALKAVLNARPGDANIGKAVVTLPKSAFLDQGHIRTICTRVQFAAKNCPAGAQYGYAKAITPLLEEPVEGPVYLRSSNHKLPDLVAALHGLVDVNIVGRIDSYKGGIRSSFETVPDAPVTKFTLTMQGGKKGLVVNSRNLCAGKNRASAQFTGQNGVPDNFHPLVKASCGGKRNPH